MEDGVITTVDPQASADEGVARHIARNSPAAVRLRIAADRKLLDHFLTAPHTVVDDPFYTCPAATNERDGGFHPTFNGTGACDCGHDARVEHRVRLLAEGYGWADETTTGE